MLPAVGSATFLNEFQLFVFHRLSGCFALDDAYTGRSVPDAVLLWREPVIEYAQDHYGDQGLFDLFGAHAGFCLEDFSANHLTDTYAVSGEAGRDLMINVLVVMKTSSSF